jgi:diguanylate cyclase (GGDEF)-like protein
MSAQVLAGLVVGACLLVAVGAGVRLIGRLIRSMRESEVRIARLERLASTDDLTGLPNRRQWEEQLPRELGRSLRYDEPVCVAMLELDGLGEYSDAHGSAAGDRLLKEAVSAWRGFLRPYDVLARHGDEQFSLILVGCWIEEAESIIARLQATTPSGATCSAGIVHWDRDEEPRLLVERAGEALYEAKRCGYPRMIATPLTS